MLIDHLMHSACTLRRLYEQANGRCHTKKYAKTLSQSLNLEQRSWALVELISKKEAALQILPLKPTESRDKVAEAFGLSERTVSRYRANQRSQSEGSTPRNETSSQQASSSAVEEQTETPPRQVKTIWEGLL